MIRANDLDGTSIIIITDHNTPKRLGALCETTALCR